MALADAVPLKSLESNQVKVFIADQQTQGYGVAAGSKWVSPLGNLYFTICMAVTKESVFMNALHYPQVTAAAVVLTLAEFGVDEVAKL